MQSTVFSVCGIEINTAMPSYGQFYSLINKAQKENIVSSWCVYTPTQTQFFTADFQKDEVSSRLLKSIFSCGATLFNSPEV